MSKNTLFKKLVPLYAAVIAACIGLTRWGSRVVTTMVETAPLNDRTCIIVDAGHGGIDGGATSCSGVLESQINLQIALRVDALLRLLGHDTRMIRTTDTSIYTEGDTIAAQKVSDLKNRVKIVNETENSILLSIHQNTFSDGRYHGAQVFYPNDIYSRGLAEAMQGAFAKSQPGSGRKCRQAKGIYLMEKIQRPGILVECGFLSNPEEDRRLNTSSYQLQIACVIAGTMASHIENAPLNG